jgi:hypothetical protein
MTNLLEQPLVSCIMPTANRRRFVPQAIRYFQAQDYPHKELVILDDGTDSVADLIPDDSQVRYTRLTGQRPLGAKRNACVEASRGDLIMHWDDDDWHAPRRIRYQVEVLLGAQAELCGLRQMLFYDLTSHQNWLYTYPASQRLWLAGGSLLYTRNFWQRAPFPQIQIGEDARFVWSQPLDRVVVPPDHTFYVALIHPDNTSPKHCRGAYWSRWLGDLQQIVGEDIHFYQTPAVKLAPTGGSDMKLNLGCCDAPLPDFINVDLIPGPGIEVVDLRQPWPWADNAIEHIRAWDIIEHLPDKIFTMNELWRVLKPGGTAEIAVPTTEGTGAFQDPTHVSFWNRRSFLYYEAGNPYRERFARHYGIQAKFRTVQERIDHTQDGPRLTIVLRAVKP